MREKKTTFRHLLFMQIGRVLFHPFFLVSVLAQAIAFLVFVYGEYRSFGPMKDQFLYLLEGSCSAGIGKIVVPILSVLPMVSVKEGGRQKERDYFTLIRCSKRNYIGSEIVAAILSGFLVVLLGCLLFFLCLILLGYRGVGVGMGGTIENSIYASSCLSGFLKGNRGVLLLLEIIILSLDGAVWPLLLLVISQFTANKYILLIGPFLILRIWSMLTVSLGVQVYLDPIWQVIYYSASTGILTPFKLIQEYGFHICGMILFGCIYAVLFQRRMKQG